MPGWRRLRRGRGFSFVDEHGDALAPCDVDRVKALVIPPAWTDVWICPVPNGHLQAVGTDDAGRRQYLYHPDWRVKRDREKFEHMEQFARALVRRRRDVRQDLRGDGFEATRVCAAVFSLLDLGTFRIGSDRYADDDGGHGLTTLERSHVRIADGVAHFRYVAKAGQQVDVSVRDAQVVAVLAGLRRRRGVDDRLLAHRVGRRWHALGPQDVNDYIRERLVGEYTAKDFRTWRANVVAAWSLSESDASSAASRRRAVAQTMRTVSEHLGNTAAVARSSYVDPRIVDLFEDGITVAGTYRPPRPGAAVNRTLERSVIRLLRRA